MSAEIVTTAEPSFEGVGIRTAGVPDTFTKFPSICCAVRFDNYAYPSCIGCAGAHQILCCEGYDYTFKMADANSEGICCVMGSGKSQLTYPEARCKLYRQCFCMEWVCGHPLEESLLAPGDMIFHIKYNREISSLDIIPFRACCCILESCYCDAPDCFQIYRKESILCFEATLLSCKPVWFKHIEKDHDRVVCLLTSYTSVLKSDFRGCVKEVGNICCIDRRASIPCDEEVPCMCTCCPFCVCCVKGMCKCGCCATVGDLLGVKKDQPVQASAQPMPQQFQPQVQLQSQSQPQPVAVIDSPPAAPSPQVEYAQVATAPSDVVVTYDKSDD